MKEQQKPENIHTEYPTEYLIESDKGTRLVFSDELEPGVRESIRMSAKHTAQILRYVTIQRIPQQADRMNYFDMAVHDAINSLYNCGCTTMSIPMIIRAMRGNMKLKPSRKQEERVCGVVKKLITTGIEIIYDQEAEAYKIDAQVETGYRYFGAIITGEIISAQINGQVIDSCLHLEREPILSFLARQKGQMSTIDMRILDVPINLNEEGIILRNYLLARIEQSRHSKKRVQESYRTIRLDTVYKTLNISPNEYTKISRTYRKIYLLLAVWKSMYFIAGYSLDKKKIILEF